MTRTALVSSMLPLLLVTACCDNPGRDAPKSLSVEYGAELTLSGFWPNDDESLTWQLQDPLSRRSGFFAGSFFLWTPQVLEEQGMMMRLELPAVEGDTRGRLDLAGMGATVCRCPNTFYANTLECRDADGAPTGETAVCVPVRGFADVVVEPVDCCGGSDGCYVCAHDIDAAVEITGVLQGPPGANVVGTLVLREDYDTQPAGCSALIDDD